MSNILVTGANGQLGSELRDLTQSSRLSAQRYHFTDRETLDITDKNAVNDFCRQNGIRIIINCAAYTAVDKAEAEPELADKINHQAVKSLAEIAKEKKIKLVHISTDYVFDGKHYKPYTEEESTNPEGVYGKTKLDGEKAIMEINPENAVIIRTSWVYSSFGNNFVKTMLRLGKERESLGVIYDQVGTPTYARDLAKSIIQIIRNPEPRIPTPVQVYHYSNEGVASWYDFAKEIMQMAKRECRIDPIETKEYPTPAARPHYSLLNKAKIKKTFDIDIPYWKDALDECLRMMGEKK